MLIGTHPLITIPGESTIFIQLFDEEGNLLNSMSFSFYRIDVKDINVKFAPEIGREVIEVTSEPVINGYDVARSYYALIGKKVFSIRLENSLNQPIRNIFGANYKTIGLTFTGLSKEECQKNLESRDQATVLTTLAWLNGMYRNLKQKYLEEEDLYKAVLIEKVRSNDIIKKKIKVLTKSDNLWIREAAILATKTEYWP